MALAGKTFSIQDKTGQSTTYDSLDGDSPTVQVGLPVKVKAKDGGKPTTKIVPNQAVGALKVFQQVFASVPTYYAADGSQEIWNESKTAPSKWPRAGMQAALEFLGLSAEIATYDTTDEMKRKMRVGDHCSFDSHAWLCGDVRYEVTFTDSPGGKPEIWIDQGSFLRAKQGEAIPIKPGKGKARSADDRKLGKAMTAADCELARRCEDDFLGRIDALLAKDKPSAGDSTMTVDGKTRTIKKIAVVQYRIFTANVCPTNLGSTWNGSAGSWSGKVFTVDDKITSKYKSQMGISRPWAMSSQLKKQIAVARCYPTTSRQPQQTLPDTGSTS